jgi:hypothetical protein
MSTVQLFHFHIQALCTNIMSTCHPDSFLLNPHVLFPMSTSQSYFAAVPKTLSAIRVLNRYDSGRFDIETAGTVAVSTPEHWYIPGLNTGRTDCVFAGERCDWSVAGRAAKRGVFAVWDHKTGRFQTLAAGQLAESWLFDPVAGSAERTNCVATGQGLGGKSLETGWATRAVARQDEFRAFCAETVLAGKRGYRRIAVGTTGVGAGVSEKIGRSTRITDKMIAGEFVGMGFTAKTTDEVATF